MTSRIDFPSRFAGRETLVVCVLIAGVPLVLTPAGVVPTATSITSGSADPLWWPGVGALEATLPGPVTRELPRAWLDPSTVFEVFKATDPLRGDARVEALGFDVFDPDGAATAVLSAAGARVGHLLAADITATSTTITLDSTSGLPSSGAGWLGREAFTYSGISGASLTGCTRGVWGTRARARVVDSTAPALVTFGDWPRYWYGRLASVWLCRLSGTDLVDPTCLYVGTIGPGVQRSVKGTRWQLPIDNVVEILQRKIARQAVDLTGIAHMGTLHSERSPLTASAELGDASGAPDRDGWHASWLEFMADYDPAARAATPAGSGSYTGTSIQLRAGTLGVGGHYTIFAPWHDPPSVTLSDDDSDGVVTWVSGTPPPDTVVFFDGYVPLPSPGDLAKIPSTSSYTYGDAIARYTLTVDKTANRDEPLSAIILGSGTNRTMDYVRLTALVDTGRDAARRRHETLINRRTAAVLGVVSQGSSLDALRAASLALDGLDGGLHEGDVIDWDQIAGQLATVPLGAIPSQRTYKLGDGDVFLEVLSAELRLRGMAFCTRWGRLAAFRTATFAATEETVATITETDILCGDDGRPIEPEVIDSPLPVATSATFTLPNGGSYQWIDGGARSEFGDGADVKCSALEHVPATTDLARISDAIRQTAQQILGVLSVPYRAIRVPLGPRFLGLQEGDLVRFSHPRVPSTTGVIGVSALTCQVQEVRLEVMGGRGRASVMLRPEEPDLGGYAPEAFVAAGGLSVSGGHTTVTVDATTGWGAAGFARALRPDGSSSTDAVDGFAPGQKVVLQQYSTRSPIADEAFTVLTVDHATGVVVLDGEASADMLTAAASQYGCMLAFDDWPTVDGASADVVADQERYLFIADAASATLGSGDPAKRWAA